ncbi:hypothetical protein H6B15_00245 [Gemmiger formicilis]|uniref:hypothetical protein n=1 Tax=Gemmiger formicilis TaxID=745368 RepID=UPI0019592F35|nr:hypothetical protein [Gemmiger formicilis]MBM6715097.1 hypothetical protein [Gemmiger formicilis]
MDLLQLVVDLLVATCPRFTAVLLVLATALFGFCAYVFFDTAQWTGFIIFLVLAVATAALFFRLLRNGEFRRDIHRKRPGR